MRVCDLLAGEIHCYVNVQPIRDIVSYDDGSGHGVYGDSYGTADYDGSGEGQDIDEITTVQECCAFGIYPRCYYWVGTGGFEYGKGLPNGGGGGSGYPRRYGHMTLDYWGYGDRSIYSEEVVSIHL